MTDWLYNKLHTTPGSGTALVQGWSEKEKGPGLENSVSQGHQGGFRVASAHTGWAEWGLGWQFLIHFNKERKRAKELEMLKLDIRLYMINHEPLLRATV